MDPSIAADADRIAARAERELEALVGVSSPSGDHAGAEEALAICAALLPTEVQIERLPCSTAGGAPDMLATLTGTGTRRLLLLGHVDTVFEHGAHGPLRREGERLLGPGAVDMKGGVVLQLGVCRSLARRPQAFAELAVLLVTDEEWRTAPFAHVQRLSGYDACLCFEAGERTPDGEEAVVVRRKAAGTLRVHAEGQAAHSGSAPDRGRNALVALAQTTLDLVRHHDPSGPQRLSVVPTVMRSGGPLNVVPAAGELIFDMRADDHLAFRPVMASVAEVVGGATLHPEMVRQWPGMDTREATAALLEGASLRLGSAVRPASRGGASDASHFAAVLPLTVDGLGPRGGGAHSPEEFVLASSLSERAAVALALAVEALEPAAAVVAAVPESRS